MLWTERQQLRTFWLQTGEHFLTHTLELELTRFNGHLIVTSKRISDKLHWQSQTALSTAVSPTTLPRRHNQKTLMTLGLNPVLSLL